MVEIREPLRFCAIVLLVIVGWSNNVLLARSAWALCHWQSVAIYSIKRGVFHDVHSASTMQVRIGQLGSLCVNRLSPG